MAAVRELAALTGWLDYHTHDSRRSSPGFPDLILGRRAARTAPARLIVAELKTNTGRVTHEQQEWLDFFAELARFSPFVEVRLWRPRDWPDIARRLSSPWPLI